MAVNAVINGPFQPDESSLLLTVLNQLKVFEPVLCPGIDVIINAVIEQAQIKSQITLVLAQAQVYAYGRFFPQA